MPKNTYTRWSRKGCCYKPIKLQFQSIFKTEILMLPNATNQPKLTVELGYMCPRGLPGPPAVTFEVRTLKANMNSYIQLQTAAIFFSIEPLSKTGYWLGECHGWFHLQGLTGGVKNASRVRITKLKRHCGIRTRDLPLTTRARYNWVTKTDVNRVDKSSPGFYLCYF